MCAVRTSSAVCEVVAISAGNVSYYANILSSRIYVVFMSCMKNVYCHVSHTSCASVNGIPI